MDSGLSVCDMCSSFGVLLIAVLNLTLQVFIGGSICKDGKVKVIEDKELKARFNQMIKSQI